MIKTLPESTRSYVRWSEAEEDTIVAHVALRGGANPTDAVMAAQVVALPADRRRIWISLRPALRNRVYRAMAEHNASIRVHRVDEPPFSQAAPIADYTPRVQEPDPRDTRIATLERKIDDLGGVVLQLIDEMEFFTSAGRFAELRKTAQSAANLPPDLAPPPAPVTIKVKVLILGCHSGRERVKLGQLLDQSTKFDIKAEFVDVDGTPCKMHADVIIFLPSTSHKWYETMVVHNGKQRVFFIGSGGVATHAARILEHIERVAGAKAAT